MSLQNSVIILAVALVSVQSSHGLSELQQTQIRDLEKYLKENSTLAVLDTFTSAVDIVINDPEAIKSCNDVLDKSIQLTSNKQTMALFAKASNHALKSIKNENLREVAELVDKVEQTILTSPTIKKQFVKASDVFMKLIADPKNVKVAQNVLDSFDAVVRSERGRGSIAKLLVAMLQLAKSPESIKNIQKSHVALRRILESENAKKLILKGLDSFNSLSSFGQGTLKRTMGMSSKSKL